jgi:hypothetical protein
MAAEHESARERNAGTCLRALGRGHAHRRHRASGCGTRRTARLTPRARPRARLPRLRSQRRCACRRT